MFAADTSAENVRVVTRCLHDKPQEASIANLLSVIFFY